MASWSAARGRRLRELDRPSAMANALPDLQITIDQADLDKLTRAFKDFPGAIKAAMLKATESARRFTRNQLVRGFRNILSLKPSYIGKGIKSKSARMVGDGAEAEIRIATRNIPLIRYEVHPQTPPPLKGVPVAARERTTYKLRLNGRTFGDLPYRLGTGRLFVQSMGSGHIGVFYRTGKKIQEEWAPSLQYHAKADGFIDRIKDVSLAHFKKTFIEEAQHITGVRA